MQTARVHAAQAVRTWVRRPEEVIVGDDEVLVWIQTDDDLFYVLLASGTFKLASIVTYEDMTFDWEPDQRSFLKLGSDR